MKADARLLHTFLSHRELLFPFGLYIRLYKYGAKPTRGGKKNKKSGYVK
jgi:hypothetical protein